MRNLRIFPKIWEFLVDAKTAMRKFSPKVISQIQTFIANCGININVLKSKSEKELYQVIRDYNDEVSFSLGGIQKFKNVAFGEKYEELYNNPVVKQLRLDELKRVIGGIITIEMEPDDNDRHMLVDAIAHYKINEDKFQSLTFVSNDHVFIDNKEKLEVQIGQHFTDLGGSLKLSIKKIVEI